MRFFLGALFSALIACPAAAQSFDERLSTCLACHGEKGQSDNAEVPSLGGQQANYLLTQLYIFREKIRPVEIMNEQTRGFSDDDLRRYSETIAKLPPPPAADGNDQARMEEGKTL